MGITVIPESRTKGWGQVKKVLGHLILGGPAATVVLVFQYFKSQISLGGCINLVIFLLAQWCQAMRPLERHLVLSVCFGVMSICQTADVGLTLL